MSTDMTRQRRAPARSGERAPARRGTGRAGTDGYPPAGAHPTVGSAALAPEAAPATRRRPSGPQLKVAPPAPVAVPRAPFVSLVLLLVAGGVLGILLLNTKINENAFQLYDLKQEQAALDQRQQQLDQRIAQADSPAQLAEAARALGLAPATEVAYLRLPEATVVGERAPDAALVGDQPRAATVVGEPGPDSGGPTGTGRPAGG